MYTQTECWNFSLNTVETGFVQAFLSKIVHNAPAACEYVCSRLLLNMIEKACTADCWDTRNESEAEQMISRVEKGESGHFF